MTDIEYDEASARGIPCPALNVTETNSTDTSTRTITTVNTGWMLGAGWLLFLASQIMNFIFYKLHPSAPEMGTWGKEEKLEEWTPPEEKEEGKFRIILN